MTASRVVLETEDFAAAARLLHLWVADPLRSSVTALSNALAGCGAMAGSDPGGLAWAAAYDGAAVSALNAAADAVNAVDKLATMFAQTARNYASADTASTAAGRVLLDSAVGSLPHFGDPYWLPVCMPPSAAGGGGGAPAGWSLVEHLVGYVWPDGDQDRLRRAAQAWSASAGSLEHGAGDAVSAAQLAIADRLPEADDMWAVTSAMGRQLSGVAEVHRAMATACTELAAHIDAVHAAVAGELVGLIEWTAGIEVAGGLLSVVTFGLAEAPTQAAEGARLAATAARIAQLIERFIALARAAAQPLAAAVDRAGAVSAQLRAVLGARLTEAAVTAVQRYRTLRLSGEAGALGRIDRESELKVTLFPDRQAARDGLPGELRAISNKFFKRATSKSQDFKITPVPGGGYRLEFFSPAENPGYGKVYVLTTDSTGRTISRYKDTLGPDGLIERKSLPGGPE